MNKKNREQLRASIARDLVQGQGGNSPTRDLLRQYTPLEGVVSAPELKKTPALRPVDGTMAPHATVAQKRDSAWHGATVESAATVARPATVVQLAEVKGELRVPNTVSFSLFPTLEPFAKAVYYQLFLLSHGFRRDRCVVGLEKLARSVLMSKRKVQETMVYLERRGLVRRVESILGGPSKGNVYEVPIPGTLVASGATLAGDATVADAATVAQPATVASHATVAPRATNRDDDDDLERRSSSKGRRNVAGSDSSKDHRRAAAPRERKAAEHLGMVRSAYERLTGNALTTADSRAYDDNRIEEVPVDRVVSAPEVVVQRTPARVNSFNYFVKSIAEAAQPRNRAWHKKQLEQIVRAVQDNSVGRAGGTIADLADEVKHACAREGVIFDNDLFSELVG